MILQQLGIGLAATLATVIVHALFMSSFQRWFEHRRLKPFLGSMRVSVGAVLCAAIMWLLCAMLTEITLWTVILARGGAVAPADAAFYFALVSFTTLGYGDITLAPEWRIVGGFIAIDGLLIFGWSVAVLVDILRAARETARAARADSA